LTVLRSQTKKLEPIPLDVGYYSSSEASRLLKFPVRNIKRWLQGYSYIHKGQQLHSEALWQPELPELNGHLEMSFRDLIELKFIAGFIQAGLGLKAIRLCLVYARELTNDDHPFLTRKFKTDGKTIFLDSVREDGASELLDLKKKQYAIKQVIEQSFRDLDVEGDSVVRWRPLNGKPTIVLDPKRSFGQPIAADHGIPTVVLAEAVEVEGSIPKVARLYEVPVSVVKDALNFERTLQAA
jgi:uncharacterized protein (DUF433 family)